ncbi:immunity 49 family protein [Streptomyces sp. NRRL S-350]|uniref:immunity 49 family protein n=1 Tax=Streptomyces sp. NRRL S-350 TaxID=1463902 RepID=UPI0004C0EC7F|nr:immunity 49 family protein [Streptomyces sp. NRRL S-350]
MVEVTCHTVDHERISAALHDIRGRALAHWYAIEDDLTIASIRAMGDELLDYVAALSLEDPALTGADARVAMETAAECAVGVLDLGCFPRGDFRVPFPYIGETLDSERIGFGASTVDFAPKAGTWVEAFAMCVISGLLWGRDLVFGPLLVNDYAPSVRDRLPYSERTSVSDPVSLAEMDALCAYLHLVKTDTSPWVASSPEPLRKPDADERAAAGRALDAAAESWGTGLSPDQQLLRVLLDDDQAAFEEALVARLDRHRDSMPATAEPRTLLPVVTIALAALAVRAHGWELGISSGYLPASLVDPR